MNPADSIRSYIKKIEKWKKKSLPIGWMMTQFTWSIQSSDLIKLRGYLSTKVLCSFLRLNVTFTDVWNS